jgi:hypothetical protein
MLVNVGDKLKLIKSFGFFDNKNLNKECEVIHVNNEMATLKFEECTGDILCVASLDGLEVYFEKIESPKKYQSITDSEAFNYILSKSDIEIETVFNKTTVVAVRFPNNFVIVESSSCVSEENYDEELGIKLCMERIKNRYGEYIAFENCNYQYGYNSKQA